MIVRRCLSGLAVAALAIGVVPWIAATEGGRGAEPWPSPLVAEASNLDRDLALLKYRANMALNRLQQSGPGATETAP
jgi:hypothetical protein